MLNADKARGVITIGGANVEHVLSLDSMHFRLGGNYSIPFSPLLAGGGSV